MRKSFFSQTIQTARRIVIAVLGATVIIIGIALLFLPGPALIVIPAGIAILSIEFAWAKCWLREIKHGSKSSYDFLKKFYETKIFNKFIKKK